MCQNTKPGQGFIAVTETKLQQKGRGSNLCEYRRTHQTRVCTCTGRLWLLITRWCVVRNSLWLLYLYLFDTLEKITPGVGVGLQMLAQLCANVQRQVGGL